MGRPRKLGPSISFRLPIEQHAQAEVRARLRGLTVAEWIASRIVEALDRQAAPPDIYTARSKPAGTSRAKTVNTYFKQPPKESTKK